MIGYFNTDKEDVRVVVDYDHYADNPVVYTGIGLYPLEINRNYHVRDYDEKYNAEIDEAIENADEEWSSIYEPSIQQRKDFAEAWLTERNIPFYTYTVQVYRDWVLTGIFYATEDGVTVEQIRKAMPYLNAWYNGDVYRMSFQKENVYRNIDDPEDFITQWVHFDDGVCDSYGDIYELSDVAEIVKDNSEFVVVGDMEWGK